MGRILLVSSFLAIFVACNQQSKLEIKGVIDNGEGKTLYVERVEVTRTVTLDSIKLNTRGNFRFRITNPDYPIFLNLRLSDRNFITLLARPGEKIGITAESSDLLTSAEITGSPESVSVQKLNIQLRNSLTQLLALLNEAERVDSQTERNKIEEEITQIFRNQRRFSIGFILENLESLASITALYQQYDDETWVLDDLRDLQYLKIVSESLSKIWPESPHVKALVADAEQKLSEYNLSLMLAMGRKQGGEIESTYPDLALPDRDGDTLRISDLKARYVLLIFSASWDRESVRHDLGFKPVYEQYKNWGFDIYQVSMERNTQEWFRNIAFNELNWNHVSELNLLNSRSAGIYNVKNIPANFLIDKQAGIVAKDITPRELARRLEAIFN